MPEPFKNMFNPQSLGKFSLAVQAVYEPFCADEFLASTMDDTWDKLELKARGRRISTTLGRYLPADYGAAISVLDKAVESYKGPCLFCFPDFVELFGQDEENWELSVDALERYTSHSSAEFAVRPFIINHEKRMMQRMYAWSKHENEHLRRLASEGCRPQLPWGQALEKYKKDPAPILPILEQLKTDPSLYVRNSVANNINDISKTHPELIVELAKKWYGKNALTDWIVKHGCRTLLKKGNREALAIFGYHDVKSIFLEDFYLERTDVSIGDDIVFSFCIRADKPTKVRLEYGIDYVKANGKRNRKIFQISEVSLKENEKKTHVKKHSFADVSTRKHYPGTHSITLIINGAEQKNLDFELTL
jgi:DNA alkylation repair enzyme